MATSVTQERVRDNILNQVRRDMPVYDSSNKEIGTVRWVYLGATTATQREFGTGPATIAPADQPKDHSVVDAVAEVFDPTDVPEELAEKLQHSGYIRLDSHGLFAADRYILPEQIRAVTGGAVHLNVQYGQLIERA
jgi:hypothetical protein